VLRLLRHLKMLPGAPDPLPAAVYFERTEVVRSPGTGIWYPAVAEGQAVAAGSVLGVLTGFFGDTLAVLHAPFGGVMMYVVPTPAMNQGEPVGMVGVPILDR
jgi:predicted deacylase